MGKRKEVEVTDVNEDSDLGSSVDSSDESSSESEKQTGLPLSNPPVAASPAPKKKATKATEAKKRKIETREGGDKSTDAQVPQAGGPSSSADDRGGKILKQSYPQA